MWIFQNRVRVEVRKRTQIQYAAHEVDVVRTTSLPVNTQALQPPPFTSAFGQWIFWSRRIIIEYPVLLQYCSPSSLREIGKTNTSGNRILDGGGGQDTLRMQHAQRVARTVSTDHASVTVEEIESYCTEVRFSLNCVWSYTLLSVYRCWNCVSSGLLLPDNDSSEERKLCDGTWQNSVTGFLRAVAQHDPMLMCTKSWSLSPFAGSSYVKFR